MNEVFLMGRLTRDVELRTTASTSVARVGIAVDRRFSKDKDAVDFFNLVAFGKTAEFLQKYCRKGSKLIVEGRLQSSKYKDKYGDDRTASKSSSRNQKKPPITAAMMRILRSNKKPPEGGSAL